MMKMENLNKGERGFTLIEMLIAVAISGLIIAGGSAATVQIIQSTRTSAHMVALRQVQTAGHWVSQDALMAQNVTPGGGAGFPLTLTWTDWNGGNYQSVYSLETMPSATLKQLQRQETAGANATTIIVGRYIDPAQTSLVWDGDVLTFEVTASVLGAHGLQTATRIYEIQPRPN